MTTIECYRKLNQDELNKIESLKMRFCRRMKSPKRLTEPKEGTGFGDLRYAEFDKFKP